MPSSPELRSEFLKMEYGAVLERMTATRTDLWRTETVYPLAAVAIYTWLFTHPLPAAWLWQMALWLPPIIIFLALLRVAGRLVAMNQLERYCRKLETEFYGDSEPGGWEHAFRGQFPPMRVFAWVRFLVGALMLGASVCLAWNPDDAFVG